MILALNCSSSVVNQALKFTREVANWLCHMQRPMIDSEADAGRVYSSVDERNCAHLGNQWNAAFAIMGWLSAYQVFEDKRYLTCAEGAARYLCTLQIFDPFIPKHYGAIREYNAQTQWCYPRDALSAGWAMIDLYRHTGDQQWLERAVMLGNWLVEQALDEEGWPYWGVVFDEDVEEGNLPQICNDVQGSFHGGSLNFFYQLAQATSDSKWTGAFYVKMADHFIDHLQQPDGFFCSVERATHKPPATDPQNGLHRANDDLGCLGLLGAYKVTGNTRYLRAVENFIQAVFALQDERGMFEKSVACIPIVLNTLHEGREFLNCPTATDEACTSALEVLFAAQETGARNPRTYGGIREEPGRTHDSIVCVRSGCYALIVLSKLFGGAKDYLSI